MHRPRSDEYGFELPPDLIAATPLPDRAKSRLMVVHRASGHIEHRWFSDLPEMLREDDLLVLNDTKVRPSVMTSEEGNTEFTLLEETSPRHWMALVKPGRRAKPGTRWRFRPCRDRGGPVIEAEVLTTLEAGGERVLRFFGDFDPREYCALPLPPYIRKRREGLAAEHQLGRLDDEHWYQTVYARPEAERSVAAPTAGLHFTAELLDRLPHVFLTLHIGLGTFRPLKTEYLDEHFMHEEHFEIPAGLAERAAEAGRLVAVGTTSARVLESAPDLRPRHGTTRLFIRPPFEFRRVGALVTNFHLPQSTLLVLACTFGGRELILAAYQEAIRQRYRFYSYGDAMLIVE
jgi:S-adenosylmethionine:tRNA ribosyltransferase-isomerase